MPSLQLHMRLGRSWRLRGASPLSKRIGVKNLQASPLGKERMAAGREGGGWREEGAMSDLIR